MLIFRFCLAVDISANGFCVMAHHHFKKQAENRRKAQKVGRWRYKIQRYRLFVIHQVIYAKITYRCILRKHRVQIFFKRRICRGNYARAFVFCFGADFSKCLVNNRMHVWEYAQALRIGVGMP